MSEEFDINLEAVRRLLQDSYQRKFQDLAEATWSNQLRNAQAEVNRSIAEQLPELPRLISSTTSTPRVELEALVVDGARREEQEQIERSEASRRSRMRSFGELGLAFGAISILSNTVAPTPSGAGFVVGVIAAAVAVFALPFFVIGHVNEERSARGADAAAALKAAQWAARVQMRAVLAAPATYVQTIESARSDVSNDQSLGDE